MSRAAFRKADVERAVQAVKDCGLEIVSVEVQRDGTIRVLTRGERDLTGGKGESLNPWDRTCAPE